LIEALVDSTLTPCRMALADAGLAPSDVDEVVLVGGSTRVPLVRRRVQELFGRTPHSQLNPDEVVALGAAVQAHILAGGITDMLLLDVHVVQGERELVKDCRSLGRFELRIDPMPAGMPKIEVTFLIDANGILQ